MGQFDIISVTGKAFRITWDERSYLLRLALLPMVLKILCLAVASSYAADGNYLRFTLLMLPAYLAEGWMVSHYARLLVLGHRWPFRPTGDRDADIAALRIRARGVLSGTIVFALIQMGIGIVYMTGEYLRAFLPAEGAPIEQVEIPAHAGFLAMFMLFFTFWGFRLLWYYIPFALNMSAGEYLVRLRGIMPSVHMIAVWLVCLAPTLAGLYLAAGLLGALTGGATSQAAQFVFMVLTVIADTIKSLLVTGGMTFALMSLYKQTTIDKTL